MYIQSLSLSGLRCFSQTKIDFQYPGLKNGKAEFPNVNFILGNNGSGKSTLLKGISLALLSPIIESSGFVPHLLVRKFQSRFVKKSQVEAQLILHRQDVPTKKTVPTTPINLSVFIEKVRNIEKLRSEQPEEKGINKLLEEMYDDKSPAFLLIGYGANRRVESSETFDSSLRSKQRLLRYQRVASLFEEQITLVPLSRWLPEFRDKNSGQHKQVVQLINRLLPDETKFSGVYEEDYHFTHRGVTVPFSAMSDGYRAYIGWISDLLYHICMGAPMGHKLIENQGIVLVDEVDLHIHPEWQRTIIPRLAKELPQLQFIFTSHSPIVAGTLDSTNLFLAEAGPKGTTLIRQPGEEIHGLNADQILLSSYFGLKSTRAPGKVRELNDLAKKAQQGDGDASLEFLKQLIPEKSRGKYSLEDLLAKVDEPSEEISWGKPEGDEVW